MYPIPKITLNYTFFFEKKIILGKLNQKFVVNMNRLCSTQQIYIIMFRKEYYTIQCRYSQVYKFCIFPKLPWRNSTSRYISSKSQHNQTCGYLYASSFLKSKTYWVRFVTAQGGLHPLIKFYSAASSILLCLAENL